MIIIQDQPQMTKKEEKQKNGRDTLLGMVFTLH